MAEKIIVFDTTLRDGEQAPGASLTIEQKLEVAKKLQELNVDIIEAGFPVASEGEFNAVRNIAEVVKGPIICGLARALEKDIKAAYESLKRAKRFRIHTFIATSDIHMRYKLKMTKEDVLEAAKNAVRYARRFTDDVEFSPEDATRSDFDFLCRVIEETIKCGAKTINIPDTVGYALPEEFGNLIKRIIKTVPNIHKAIISVHCHNDLGLATANTISAILSGARQVECTINGIGERAGNASLEEVVMTIYSRRKSMGFYTDINTREIFPTSKLVSSLMRIPVQPNKAIVGANAFAHAAGIHQHGVIMKRVTYEHINPKIVGVSSSKLVLAKHSGRHAFEKKLKELGFRLSKNEQDAVFIEFKRLADRKKYIYDADIIALVDEMHGKAKEVISLDYFHIFSGSSAIPSATVRLRIKQGKKEIVRQEAGCGDGPFDAACDAIDRIVGFKAKLCDYNLKAVTSGKDAVGEAGVVVEYKKKKYTGKGVSTDILEASLRSYIDALNKIVFFNEIKFF